MKEKTIYPPIGMCGKIPKMVLPPNIADILKKALLDIDLTSRNRFKLNKQEYHATTRKRTI